MSGNGLETYLTIEEMAAYLKLAAQTIRRYVLNREIPYHKIKKVIRFRVSEIERWIDSGGLDTASRQGQADIKENELFDLQEAAGDTGGFDDGN